MPTKAVPNSWFPELREADVRCLASGGGQQGPIRAAAGARVTVWHNSPRQLAHDRLVGDRESPVIDTVLGDRANLTSLAVESFDLIVHPVCNTFGPHLSPVWAEAYRVLRRGGLLSAGFTNPAVYLFDS
jgi:SAM-dependent methyltransferase